MLIGARTAAWSGGGAWVNPFITEGLVAMWHGLWNVAGGVHDDNATTWFDLSGNGYGIDLTNATIGSDFVSVAGRSIGCTLPEVQRIEFTAEIVVNSNPGTGGSALWIANPAWVGGLLMDWQAAGQFYYPWANIAKYNSEHGNLASIQLTYKDGNQKLFVNGSKIAEMSGSINASRSYLTRLKLGEYNGVFSTAETYKCVRLYDRWFTDAEIALNHAEDLREFGV